MPITDGNYVSPEWHNDQGPAKINRSEMQAITDTIEKSQILTGDGAPTAETAGSVGQLYRDESTEPNTLYRCTDDSGGEYRWEEDSAESISAGDGIVIEDGEISLPTVFYDYLLRETYEAPVLTLTMSGIGGAHEIGDALTISSVTHRETNPENVEPGTLKFYRGSTEVQALTPTATNETVTLDDPISEAGSSAGSVTYALRCEDTMGAQKSSSVTATWNRYVYTKVGSPNTVPTAASDCVKQASLASFASNGATFSYSAGTCIWMLTTNQNAVIQTYVLGEWAGANMHSGGSVSFTQANGTTAAYYAFRTDEFVAAGSAKYRITNS